MARYEKNLPKDARFIAHLSANIIRAVPISLRDYSYWSGDLYLAGGRTYLQGVGGPASPFQQRVEKAGASIGGRGVIRVDSDIARDWLRRGELPADPELDAIADRIEREEREMGEYFTAADLAAADADWKRSYGA